MQYKSLRMREHIVTEGLQTQNSFCIFSQMYNNNNNNDNSERKNCRSYNV